MSTAIVQAEIERFLRSPEPEVLCISGRWGVGKTYTWQTLLERAETDRSLGMRTHAYVSLFGLSTLNDLRNAIVENTVRVGSPPVPDPSSPSSKLRRGENCSRKGRQPFYVVAAFAAVDGWKSTVCALKRGAVSLYEKLRRGGDFARKKPLLQGRPLLETTLAFFGKKDVGDALYRVAFLAVRHQLICFDDLERSGKTLEMMDILGLASFLREQRQCKVVLLLNKEQAIPEQSRALERQLEKVVDTFLVFDPTSVEAAAIAIAGNDPVAEALRDRLVALDVTNVRVMKKIERWGRIVENELQGFEPEIVVRAVATLVLAGWCFLQRDRAPDLDFVREFSSIASLYSPDAESDERKSWGDVLRRYGYTWTDELASLIIEGVRLGYFRGEELRAAAETVRKALKSAGRTNSFMEAWNLYHRSLTTDDDQILDAMYAGALENLTEVSPDNMNATICFLRRYGRGEQASELVARYMDTNREVPNFLSRQNWHIAGEQADRELFAALEAERAAVNLRRDPAEMLKAMATTNSYNPTADAARLSLLSADDLEKLFDEHADQDVKGMMTWADQIASQPGAEALRASLDEAFRRIAARSRMRADRLRSWGVLPTD